MRFESPRAFDPKGRGACTGRAALERRTVHNIDVIADPEYNDGGRQLDPDRTVLAIPMLKADDLLGVILIYRHKVLAFTDSQIALMETFADQAVIAIENTRLFEEVQARTCELQESLEYQTATAEVLNVISRSPNQLQPVLDAIVGTADRLCRSEFAAVYRLKDDKYWLAATNRIDPTILNILRQEPITPGRGTIVGRAALERRTLRVLDCLADPEFGWLEAQRAGKHRTMLAVQLLRDHAPSGVVILSRTVVMPFSNKEIELVESFADQAVIAIENTRLFGEVQARTRELTEALEQQTATSEVLGVISSSPGELEPVFSAMLENAVRICGAKFGNLWLREGHTFRIWAPHGAPAKYMECLRRQPLVTPDPRMGMGQIVRSKAAIHVADIRGEPAYADNLRIATIELADAARSTNT